MADQNINKDLTTLACGICDIKEYMDQSIQCSNCHKWIHYKCTKYPMYALRCLAKTQRKFDCESCSNSKYSDQEWDQAFKSSLEQQGKMKLSDKQTQINRPYEAYSISEARDKDLSEGTVGNSETRSVTVTQAAPERQTGQTHNGSESENSENNDNTPRVTDNRENGSSDREERGTRPKVQKICKFYKLNKCKFHVSGTGCRYAHPRACPKLLKFGLDKTKGCTLGRKCDFYHPKLCFESMYEGTCSRNKCSFTHIHGTQKIKNPEAPNKEGRKMEKEKSEKIQERDFLENSRKIQVLQEQVYQILQIVQNQGPVHQQRQMAVPATQAHPVIRAVPQQAQWYPHHQWPIQGPPVQARH